MTMLWVAALAMMLAAGWFLASVLTAGAWQGPKWAGLAAALALGVLLGPGVASILYFAMVAAGMANRGSVLSMLATLLAGSAVLWWTSRASVPPSEAQVPKAFRWTWVLW